MSEPGSDRPSDSDCLEAVRELEPAGTSEIARAVDVPRQSAVRRLRSLEDEGFVTSKRMGTSHTWVLAEAEDEFPTVDRSDELWTAETFEGEAMRASEIDDAIYR